METLSEITPVELAKECAVLNEFEQRLATMPPCPYQPVFQRLTPGLYMRTIRLSAGVVCTSKIHKTTHQFIVSRGVFEMWSEEGGLVMVDASKHPILGATKPGSRRAFRIIEETYFSLFFPTDCTDLSQIEAEMIEPHFVPTREGT